MDTVAIAPTEFPMVATGKDVELEIYPSGETKVRYTGWRSSLDGLFPRKKRNKNPYPKAKPVKRKKQRKIYKKRGQSR